MDGLLDTALAWVEATGVAIAVGNSVSLTAWLSAIHLIGVTLVGGGALVAGLRCSGLLFADQELRTVLQPAGRAIGAGVMVSVVTGVLLVSPRAVASAANGFFQWKMSFLLAAAACDVLFRRWGSRLDHRAAAAGGFLRSVLYGGVIVAGCAFILLE